MRAQKGECTRPLAVALGRGASCCESICALSPPPLLCAVDHVPSAAVPQLLIPDDSDKTCTENAHMLDESVMLCGSTMHMKFIGSARRLLERMQAGARSAAD